MIAFLHSSSFFKHMIIQNLFDQRELLEDHPYIAISMNNLGFLYVDLKNLKKALKFYKKSWGVWKKNLPKEHSSKIAITLQHISNTYEKLNKPKKALKYKERLRKLGFDSPDTE